MNVFLKHVAATGPIPRFSLTPEEMELISPSLTLNFAMQTPKDYQKHLNRQLQRPFLSNHSPLIQSNKHI